MLSNLEGRHQHDGALMAPMVWDLVWFPCSFSKHNHRIAMLKHNWSHVSLKLTEKRNWLSNLLWHPLFRLGQSLYWHLKHGNRLMHEQLWPQLEDSFSKHDKVVFAQNMNQSCVWVQFKTSRTEPIKLFEFVLVSDEIPRSFNGFIHIHNWVLWNMDNNSFLENCNVNLDIWNLNLW
jgi:hypothetical protein